MLYTVLTFGTYADGYTDWGDYHVISDDVIREMLAIGYCIAGCIHACRRTPWSGMVVFVTDSMETDIEFEVEGLEVTIA